MQFPGDSHAFAGETDSIEDMVWAQYERDRDITPEQAAQREPWTPPEDSDGQAPEDDTGSAWNDWQKYGDRELEDQAWSQHWNSIPIPECE
jgi:hypothetical protein